MLVHHAHIDHVRADPDVRRARVDGKRRLARAELTTLDETELAQAPRFEPDLLRIVRHAQNLPAVDRHVLALWLAGHSAEEIAVRLSLASSDDANRILHATRQRLRRLVRQGER